MPILFTHLLSGLVASALMLAAYRKRSVPLLLLGWTAFAFMLPDLDHLLVWEPSMAGKILPSSLQDIVAGLFEPRRPSMLHCWALPALLAAAAAALRLRGSERWRYVAAAALGCSVHLLMDGVMLF